jgi:hypothetical protein
MNIKFTALFWSITLSLAWGENLPPDDPENFVKEMKRLTASTHDHRVEDVAYEMDFLLLASKLVDLPLLQKMIMYQKEKSVCRYLGLNYSVLELDKITFVNPGENLVFAWRWTPETFDFVSAIESNGVIEIQIREKLEPSKIYAGYSGSMKIQLVKVSGILKLKNIVFSRRVTDGSTWESDLQRYLDESAAELKKRREEFTNEKGRSSSRESLAPPLEVIEKMK